jgi:hypothetical protein
MEMPTMTHSINLARWLDSQPPDYAEAHINLIDALHDYIRSMDMLTQDLYDEGSITREETKKWHGPERQSFRLILEKLEAAEAGICMEWMLKNGRRDC